MVYRGRAARTMRIHLVGMCRGSVRGKTWVLRRCKSSSQGMIDSKIHYVAL